MSTLGRTDRSGTRHLGSAAVSEPKAFGGRFEPHDQLRTGAVSWTFAATDRETDKAVTLEVFFPDVGAHPRFKGRFERGLRAAAAIDHRNVAKTVAAGRDHGSWFLVTEIVEGRPLDQVLREDGPLGVDHAVEVAADLIDALSAAHRCDVVHGDLTIAAVIMAADGRVKVTGFGPGRAVGAEADREPAPTEATDLQALGAILRAGMADDTTATTALSPLADDLVDGRFGSAREVRAALLQIDGGRLADHRRPDGHDADDPEGDRRPPMPWWLRGAVGLLALVALAGLGVYLTSRFAPGDPPARPFATVPDVVDQPQPEAIASLQAAGFDSTFESQRSRAIDRGSVIEQIPAAGERLREGDKVTLVVSSGAGFVTIPLVLGMTQTEAEAALVQVGLAVAIQPEPRGGIPVGTVFDQIPGGNNQGEFGDVVTLRVSTG